MKEFIHRKASGPYPEDTREQLEQESSAICNIFFKPRAPAD